MDVPQIYDPSIIVAFTRSRGIEQEYTEYFGDYGMHVWAKENVRKKSDLENIDRWFKAALAEVGMTLPMYAALSTKDQYSICAECIDAAKLRILAKDVDAHMMTFDQHGYADSFDCTVDFRDVETRTQRLIESLKTQDGLASIIETMQGDIEVDERPGDDQILQRLFKWQKESGLTPKQRLYVDMDGTLAVFQKVDKLETLYEEGYFLHLAPNKNVVEAVRQIIVSAPDIEVYVLSACLTDSKYALAEKNQWLDRLLPELKEERRIFPPCGEDKKAYITGGVRKTDFLLDDYTKNLMLWQPPARGIKLLNGINHTAATWQADCLRFDKSPEELAKNIQGIMKGECQVIDSRPINYARSERDQER